MINVSDKRTIFIPQNSKERVSWRGKKSERVGAL